MKARKILDKKEHGVGVIVEFTWAEARLFSARMGYAPTQHRDLLLEATRVAVSMVEGDPYDSVEVIITTEGGHLTDPA